MVIYIPSYEFVVEMRYCGDHGMHLIYLDVMAIFII
jgi:hypothetical protein